MRVRVMASVRVSVRVRFRVRVRVRVTQQLFEVVLVSPRCPHPLLAEVDLADIVNRKIITQKIPANTGLDLN